MKSLVLALFTIMSLAGSVTFAAEASNSTDSQNTYVLEPMHIGPTLICPRGSRLVGKFCWDQFAGHMFRCGSVCLPTDTPNPQPEPNSGH